MFRSFYTAFAATPRYGAPILTGALLTPLVKVYGSMYVSKAMNILLKVLNVKNLDGLLDPASEVSGVIPNLY